MKTRIPAILLLLVFMAILPFAAAICAKSNNNTLSTASTADEPKKVTAKAASSESIILNMINSVSKNDYCNEAIKAIAILMNTNYKAKPNEYTEYNNSDSEISNDIRTALKDIKDKTLLHNNKAVFIPCSTCSNGSTYSGKYTYLSAVASPQDYFSENFSEDTICCGVSLDGINYLCNNGMSAEDALLYYLPNFKIK